LDIVQIHDEDEIQKLLSEKILINHESQEKFLAQIEEKLSALITEANTIQILVVAKLVLHAKSEKLKSIIHSTLENAIKKLICELEYLALEPIRRISSFEFLDGQQKGILRTNQFYGVSFREKELLALMSRPKLNRESRMAFINKWLKHLNVGTELLIGVNENDQTITVSIKQSNGDSLLIADAGFGIYKLLDLLLLVSQERLDENDIPNFNVIHMAYANIYGHAEEKHVIFLEEPEANLHPALQSKLADMFVDASKTFNTQFIIETHSEYLIRKLQYLTAKKEIKPEHTVIYYFYPPDHPDVVSGREPQVKKININDDGSLTGEFGSGFFDEADNIALELFLLKKSQEN
jgi:predicted ATPase